MIEMQAGKVYHCGRSQLCVGRELFQLRDSSSDRGDLNLLRERLQVEGYLYLRNFYQTKELNPVQIEIKDILKEEGLLVFDEVKNKWIPSKDSRSKLFKTSEYDKLKAYLQLIAGEKIKNLFSEVREEEIYTYPYKWLRAVQSGGHTGMHFDNVYMGRGSDKLLTCWTALEDIPLEKGGLLLGGEFNNLHLLRDSYGKVDVDNLNLDHGWYCDDLSEVTPYFGGKWYSSNFSAGDIVIFGMFQLHGSLNNSSDTYRISCDTRFQSVSEQRDPRWEMKEGFGHTSSHTTKIADLKKEWRKSFV